MNVPRSNDAHTHTMTQAYQHAKTHNDTNTHKTHANMILFVRIYGVKTSSFATIIKTFNPVHVIQINEIKWLVKQS